MTSSLDPLQPLTLLKLAKLSHGKRWQVLANLQEQQP